MNFHATPFAEEHGVVPGLLTGDPYGVEDDYGGDGRHSAGGSVLLSGDPYGMHAEEDEVSRFGTYPSPESFDAGKTSTTMMMMQEDEVTRFGTFPSPESFDAPVATKGGSTTACSFFGLEDEDEDEAPPKPPGWAVEDLLEGGHDEDASRPRSEDFASGPMPPPLPQDEFFYLLPANLKVTTSSPDSLGNDLADFFRIKLGVQNPKVRPNKYTFKGNVAKGEVSCTVKLRVYRQEENVFVVEAQRRQGDVVFFMNVFRALDRFLGGRPEIAKA